MHSVDVRGVKDITLLRAIAATTWIVDATACRGDTHPPRLPPYRSGIHQPDTRSRQVERPDTLGENRPLQQALSCADTTMSETQDLP